MDLVAFTAGGRALLWYRTMPNDPYFPFYFRDFMVSTGEMSDAVVGKYVRYLIHQWEKGSLPADPEDIQTIRCDRIAWASLEPKFPLCSDNRRRNPKMERIRSEREQYLQRRSDAGKAGAEARWNDSKRNASAIATANSKTDTIAIANGMASTPSSSSSSSSSSKPPAKEIRADQTAFDRFWSAYPKSRRIGKKKCVDWWKSHKPENLEQMLETLKVWKLSDEWADPKFIPHPLTWLNRGGWDDEVSDEEPALRKTARMEVRTGDYDDF